jgi:sortase A
MRPVSLSSARPRLRRVRAALRFVASVMMVSGTLLIADAALTLLWQEPISAFLAARQQDALADELEEPETRAAVIQAFRDPVKRERLRGDAIGKIELPAIDKSYYVVEGTDTASLRKGPGHYEDTPLPGQRGTVAIAGHRTTNGAPFRNIDNLDPRDEVRVEMPYGTFVYRVERTKIVDDNDLSVKDEVSFNRLILSACHPLYSAAQRIIVFARFQRREAPEVKRSS